MNGLISLGSAAAFLVAGWFLLNDRSQTGLQKQASRAAQRTLQDSQFRGEGEVDSTEPPLISPTQGKPLDLRYVPGGARVVIQLHPSVLWTNGGKMEEFRACCGPLSDWLAGQLKKICLDEPANLEEVLFAFIPAEKGNPPDLATVVRLIRPMKKSALLDRFKARRMDDNRRHPYYVDDQRAFYAIDDRSYAIVPRVLTQELLTAIDNPGQLPDTLESLLAQTDRDRQVTILFEPVAVRIDAPFLFNSNVQPLAGALLDWLGPDIVGAAWSWHLGNRCFSELQVRNEAAKSPERLHRQLIQKLFTTPQEILAAVETLQPRTRGTRKIVGRFPAMTNAYALSTRIQHSTRLVSLRTELPDRAAPNLALGALLTWQEFARGIPAAKPVENLPPPPPTAPSALSLAERLQKTIDVDFRNEPLYAALDYIGTETGTKFKIEGNDLKMVGVTQNMKQQFRLDATTAVSVLDRMLTSLGLVVVLDEKQQLVIVTSAKAAEERRWVPLPLLPRKPGK